jgi:hypothetical protein
VTTRWFVRKCVWAAIVLAGFPIATVRAAPEADRTVVRVPQRFLPEAACALPSPLTPLSTCIRDARNVLIGPGGTPTCQDVVVDRSYTGAEALGRIQIQAGGRLFIPDRTVTIETAEVDISGVLQAGTADCPIGTANRRNRVTLVLTGARPMACTVGERCQQFDKGIQVEAGGTLRLFGTKGVPPSGVSWTYLRRPAGPEDAYGPGTGTASPVPAGGGTTLQLAADVTVGAGAWQGREGLQEGDWIAVATTSFSPFETEFVQIKSLRPNGTGGTEVALAQPLKYYHFGGGDPGAPGPANFSAGEELNYGVDERAEVGLISRHITLTARIDSGDPRSQNWGGEIQIHQGFAEVSLQGVEVEKFGKDQLGSYPIHFHMAGDVQAQKPLVNANSVHHSFNKCVTVHSTSNLTVEHNVCARIVGHLFYQEIGDEEGITFANNLGLGAMSNAFDIHAPTPQRRLELISGYWWAGDNLARTVNFNYNGFNIPNTDKQDNPTHGTCWTVRQDGGLQGGSDPPCTPGQLYTEPASGFWIINPGTNLVGNSVAGCQGVGRGYWYVPPKDGAPDALKFKPLGAFKNNRAHGCYAGVYAEDEYSVRSDQLFPHEGGLESGRPLIARLEGITATRNRFRGIWLRPTWFVVSDARVATNRENVTLVSTGGLDGNAPGVWLLLKDSVLVGLSMNNVDRFGPCPVDNQLNLGAPSGGPWGCIDRTPIPGGQRLSGGDEVGLGYPDPFWNFSGYMLYDGPALVFDNRFVNFVVQYRTDGTMPHLTGTDQAFLTHYQATHITPHGNLPFVYEGDAALGWFQGNPSNYPTATAGKGFSFTNVDFRHQIYTEQVNLSSFNDGDKNTAILDLDGTLTGFEVVDADGHKVHGAHPISLNNLEFNALANSVDECLATGAQDQLLEGRPTSLISPGSMATLEFSALWPNPKPTGPQDQWLTFTRDDTDDFGMHKSMTLGGRNGNGVWEPKVASGYGYTVSAGPGAPPGRPVLGSGIPKVIDVGVIDVVKPNISPENPFYIRLGICYTDQNGQHPPDGLLTIRRGYKSYGGGNVNPNSDPELHRYWNQLVSRYGADPGGEFCHNLDHQNPQNLAPSTYGFSGGCPAHGITAVPAGGCPAGSTVGKDRQDRAACIYPPTEMTAVTSEAGVAGLQDADGAPRLDKFFYDQNSGMLFFYVAQETPNAFGPAPLGSCRGLPGGPLAADDGDCQPESYYGCPAQGCLVYIVELDDDSYIPGPSTCAPYPSYAQPAPEDVLQLVYRGTTTVVGRAALQGGKGGQFPHYPPALAPSCPTSTGP